MLLIHQIFELLTAIITQTQVAADNYFFFALGNI